MWSYGIRHICQLNQRDRTGSTGVKAIYLRLVWASSWGVWNLLYYNYRWQICGNMERVANHRKMWRIGE